jgi:topoisomerase IA-like protein
MTDYWPLSITEHGVGLNITVMSYAGTVGFGFTTARCAVPDARELTAALLEAFDELVAGPVKRPRTKAAAKKVAVKTVAAKKPPAKKPPAKKAAAKKAPARPAAKTPAP